MSNILLIIVLINGLLLPVTRAITLKKLEIF